MVDAYKGLSSLESVPEGVVSLSEAIMYMEESSKIQREDPYIFLRLGTLYFQAERDNEAIDAYKNALLRTKPLSTQHSVEIIQRIGN